MSNESVKPPAEPAQQLPKPPDIKNDSGGKNPPNPPIIPPVQERPAENPNSGRNEKNLTKWNVFERGVKIVECVALIAGVITAIFIGYQWKEMRKASVDAEHALDLNRQQLDAMKSQSDIMQIQLDESMA